jgi:putative transposase
MFDYYRRNLPHWQPKGEEYFITFRLAGTLPAESIARLKKKQKHFRLRYEASDISKKVQDQFYEKMFEYYDHILDNGSTGPVWLSNKNIAQLIADSIHFYNQKCYDLYAFTIMSNHVHLVFRHLEKIYNVDFPVTNVLKNIKSYSGKEANKILGRSGKFWQSESYDRVIRDENELENIIKYTLNNPVKAGLISDWKDWPFSYCKIEFIESL